MPQTHAELLFDHTMSISENIFWDATVFCTNYFDETLCDFADTNWSGYIKGNQTDEKLTCCL